jgi:type IV secretory pathway TrbL component
MDLLNKIPKDKLLHFFVGSVILFLSLLVFNTLVSISIVVLAAVVKEIVYDDFLGKGTPEVQDFVYTILPCVFHLFNTLL